MCQRKKCEDNESFVCIDGDWAWMDYCTYGCEGWTLCKEFDYFTNSCYYSDCHDEMVEIVSFGPVGLGNAAFYQ